MNRMKTMLAAAAALSMTAGTALAADIAPVFVPAAPVVVAPVATTYDWSGLYVGVLGGVQLSGGPPPYMVAGQAGFNFQPGRLVLGVEVRAGAYLPGADFHYNIEGRVGVALGATGRILAYGVGGVVLVPCCTTPSPEFGAGVEFAVGERLSVFGEGRRLFGGYGFRAGVNFHL